MMIEQQTKPLPSSSGIKVRRLGPIGPARPFGGRPSSMPKAEEKPAEVSAPVEVAAAPVIEEPSIQVPEAELGSDSDSLAPYDDSQSGHETLTDPRDKPSTLLWTLGLLATSFLALTGITLVYRGAQR